MSGPGSPVRQQALAFMVKVLAFQKARRESPDFDGFLRRIKQLGRIQMHSAGPSALLAAYGRALRVIAASAVFGLSDKHAHVLIDLYLSGFGHGFHGIEALSNSAIPPSLHVSRRVGMRAWALGKQHGLGQRQRRAKERQRLSGMLPDQVAICASESCLRGKSESRNARIVLTSLTSLTCAIATGGLADLASATDYTVTSHTTVTNGGYPVPITATGDALSVDAGASITVGGTDAGVYFQDNAGGTITNDGVITAGTPGAQRGGNAILVRGGSDVTATNYGTFFINDRGTNGFFLDGTAGGSFTNAGDILAAGPVEQAWGYYILGGADISAVNAGTILLVGDDSAAIYAQSSLRGVLENKGTIELSGDSVLGIRSDSTFVSIVNSGTLKTTGRAGRGITSFGANAHITNSGLIDIDSAGGASRGMTVIDPETTILNTKTGVIRTNGPGGAGNEAPGIRLNYVHDGLIINDGTISTKGPTDSAILALNSVGVVVENSGTIVSHAAAIHDEAGSISITNSGRILGDILTGTLDDILTLDPGSTTSGRIVMGDGGVDDGSDLVTVRGTADIGGVTVLDGGDDVYAADGAVDRLTFDGGVLSIDSGVLTNWEQITLINGAITTLSGPELLVGSGGSASGLPLGLSVGTGATAIFADPFSTVIGDATNSGTISLQNGRVDTRLAIAVDPLASSTSGTYTGAGGTLALDTVLDADGSPSDHLIIDGGTATGASGITVYNIGGGGDLTTGDGINVVNVINGATTGSHAFFASGPIAAGPFEYFLYRGDAGGAGDDWFLRSKVINPILRPEAPAHLVAPELSFRMGIAETATFHERRGDQRIIDEPGNDNGPVWWRFYGQSSAFGADGILETSGYNMSPHFDGRIVGFQIGTDLWGRIDQADGIQRAGLFAGVTGGSGNTYGNVMLQDHTLAGRIDLNSHHLGGTWTYLGAEGGYIDAVGMMSHISGDAISERGVLGKISGTTLTASIEAGQRFALSQEWSFEPQGQVIWRNVALTDGNDGYADIAYGATAALTARLGVRLERLVAREGRAYLWHAGAMLWHTAKHRNEARFNDWTLSGDTASTSLELNAGLAANLDNDAALYGNVKYGISLDADNDNTLGVQLGLKVRF
jgi:outer membrane autotransporter protein